MSNEGAFFILLIEGYAAKTGLSGAAVLERWREHGVVQYAYSMYDLYHLEPLEDAFEDLDRHMATV
ncbi:MAG: DUF3791 domain-containing protein [Bifidobacteriaceae bacterium]|jgi:hypothetical protein|nr:DUF3791 domain-containing protein [Bifidobacteriaceae bacterium]